jgi:hypothetical protein
MKNHFLVAGLTMALVAGVLHNTHASETGPMQKWMRSNLAGPMGQANTPALAKGLRYAAGKPVPGMDQWTRIANQGADAADKGDVEGTKASCKACHTLYQKIYKETRRQENW